MNNADRLQRLFLLPTKPLKMILSKAMQADGTEGKKATIAHVLCRIKSIYLIMGHGQFLCTYILGASV